MESLALRATYVRILCPNSHEQESAAPNNSPKQHPISRSKHQVTAWTTGRVSNGTSYVSHNSGIKIGIIGISISMMQQMKISTKKGNRSLTPGKEASKLQEGA
jgi:hypothetical protein